MNAALSPLQRRIIETTLAVTAADRVVWDLPKCSMIKVNDERIYLVDADTKLGARNASLVIMHTYPISSILRH